MKLMLTRNKKYSIIICVEAFIIAVVLHLLLLVIFSPPKTETQGHNKMYQRISMLSLKKDSEFINSINTWMEFADPTLISKPSEDFGYGVITRHRGFRPLRKSDVPGTMEKKLEFIDNSKHFNLTSVAASGEPALVIPNYLAPEIKNSGMPVTRYPRIISARGQVIPDVFVDKKEIAVQLEKSTPGDNTVIEFKAGRVKGLLPRFRIVKSCGVIQLDNLAVRKMIGSEVLAGLLKENDFASISVRWTEASSTAINSMAPVVPGGKQK